MKDEDKFKIANMLNCKLGELPIKYLGIPISDVKLGMGALAETPEKIAKRIPPWKGKHMSSKGSLILSNSYLSSLPTYNMGFYLFSLGTHRKMDSLRSRFY
jgi:hypothetical protein